jgi:hypothetical protein
VDNAQDSKTCSKCGKVDPECGFRKGSRQCNDCVRDYAKQRQRRKMWGEDKRKKVNYELFPVNGRKIGLTVYPMPPKKHCYKCETDKEPEEFYDKFKHCKECTGYIRRDLYENDPEVRAKAARYLRARRENPEFVELLRERGRNYYANNRDLMLARAKESLSKPGARSRKRQYDESLRKRPEYRETRVNYDLLRLYGITLDRKKEMFNHQNGRCDICNVVLSSIFAAHVDHCHASGKVRGLLCNKCNVGLGAFNDSISNFLEAARYIEKHS